jgi:hypothetical protein
VTQVFIKEYMDAPKAAAVPGTLEPGQTKSVDLYALFTDKVLAALFLGINVQHGHPQAVGTDADVPLLRAKWKTTDPNKVQPYLLTPAGLKRIPAAAGKPILNNQG